MPGFPKVLARARRRVPRRGATRSTRRPTSSREAIARGRPRRRRGAAPTRSARISLARAARKLARALRRRARRLRRRAQVPEHDGARRAAPSRRARGRRARARRVRLALDAHARRRDLGSARRRLPPLLDRRALARAALREDALRQRAPPAPLRRRHGAPSATPRYAETARAIAALRRARDDRRPRAASTRRRTPTARAKKGSSSSGRRPRSTPRCAGDDEAARGRAGLLRRHRRTGTSRSTRRDRALDAASRSSAVAAKLGLGRRRGARPRSSARAQRLLRRAREAAEAVPRREDPRELERRS